MTCYYLSDTFKQCCSFSRIHRGSRHEKFFQPESFGHYGNHVCSLVYCIRVPGEEQSPRIMSLRQMSQVRQPIHLRGGRIWIRHRKKVCWVQLRLAMALVGQELEMAMEVVRMANY